jgi:hypothetical protein
MYLKALATTIAFAFFPTQLCGEIRILGVTAALSARPGVPAQGSAATVYRTGLNETAARPPVLIGDYHAPILALARVDGYQQLNFLSPRPARP